MTEKYDDLARGGGILYIYVHSNFFREWALSQ